MEKVNRSNIGTHLFTYQLSIIGKKPEDIVDNDKWKFQYTMNKEQYTSFRGYAVRLIQKVFRCNRKKAEENFEWFYDWYGVRIKG